MQKPEHLIEIAAGGDDTHNGVQLFRTHLPAVPAGTIPLWKSAAGGGTKNLNLHESELQCCYSIRVDLARH